MQNYNNQIERAAGILLHITSLHNEEGIGTLGPEAHRFIDSLNKASQKYWQMLPIHPTIEGDSPFQGPSVFAGNPNLISLEGLVNAGDLSQENYGQYLSRYTKFKEAHNGRSDNYVEYGFIWENKLGFDSKVKGYSAAALRQAYEGFKASDNSSRTGAFQKFCEENAKWLDDYADFMALKEMYGFGRMWNDWDKKHKDREERYNKNIDKESIRFYKYVQFVFDEQMTALRHSAKNKGVKLIGDVPIYPAYDSADVWANRELFRLDSNGNMTHAAGVPPDYFSKDGQLWGNPLYRWGGVGNDVVSEKIYNWWLSRLERLNKYFDVVRIDHFRGFVAAGTVKAGAKDARDAVWIPGPCEKVVDYLHKHSISIPDIIAEDFGIITNRVRDVLAYSGFPGMKALQFADFSNPHHIYLPHNAESNSVFYTGTHDNETFRQWFDALQDKDKVVAYLKASKEEESHWKAIDLVHSSKSKLVIIPLPDVFALGPEARMNHPGTKGWWRWRIGPELVDKIDKEFAHLKEITIRTKRD